MIRRLVMMFALVAFVSGTVLSAGCGGTEEKKADPKKEAAKTEAPADDTAQGSDG